MTDLILPDPTAPGWSREQIDLVKRTVAKGCNDDELRMFMHVCAKSGLDPFMRQIYAIKRWDKRAGRDVMTIQTSIDGFRVVADRTGKYAPGREPTFTHDADGHLVSATAYIKKQTDDGTWHECAATARYDEYVQRGMNGEPTAFWEKMRYNQTAKCAEALNFRRAFPIQLASIYTFDEMAQAEVERDAAEKFPRLRPKTPKPSVMAVIGAPAAVTDETGIEWVEREPGSDDAVVEGDVGAGAAGEAAPAQEVSEPLISDAARKALEATIRTFVNPEEIRQQIHDQMGRDLGIEHFKELTKAQFDTIMAWLAKKRMAGTKHERRVKR